MTSTLKSVRTRRPNCGHCRKREVCVKLCPRLEQYFNDLIPHKGREFPIGIPRIMGGGGISKIEPYDVSSLKVLNSYEKRALALRIVNTPIKEIAKMLDISPKYMRHMLYIARQKLRHYVDKTDKGEENQLDDPGTETLSRRVKSGEYKKTPA